MVYPTDILGSLLFNINSLDMLFEQKDVKFAAYADDNIPYFINKNLGSTSQNLQIYNGFQIII